MRLARFQPNTLRSPKATILRSACLALAMGVGVGAYTAPQSAVAAVPSVKKMAMVDMQRVLNETTAGKAARKKLESEGKAKAAKFDKKRAELEAAFAKFQKMAPAAQAREQEKLQRDQLELQNFYTTMQQGLMEDEAKMTERIYKNSSAIVKDLAAELGLDLVLVRDPMTVIFSKEGLDISSEVIKRYNSKHSKRSSKKSSK